MATWGDWLKRQLGLGGVAESRDVGGVYDPKDPRSRAARAANVKRVEEQDALQAAVRDRVLGSSAAADKHARALRARVGSQAAAFDARADKARQLMRHQATQGVAATQGRSHRQNVGAVQDTALQYGVHAAKAAADMSLQRENLMSAAEDRAYSAEQAASDRFVSSREKVASMMSVEQKAAAQKGMWLSQIAGWKREADDMYKEDPEQYVRQKISAAISQAIGEGQDPSVISFLESEHARYRPEGSSPEKVGSFLANPFWSATKSAVDLLS